MLDASDYIMNRKVSKTAITDKRISQILTYVIDCYLMFKDDGITYTEKEKGKISQEDYFRNGLVDDYLRKNLNLINMSSTTEIRFAREATETYTDSDGVKHDDKIDVHITDTALQKSWNHSDDAIYYAIECKRIKTLSDTTAYVGDIKKFTERDYTSTRLPFEGQIAFVEDSKIKDVEIIDSTNKKLGGHDSIITKEALQDCKLHSTFESCYSSKHLRNSTKELFVIHHLLFDYSNVVMN